MSSKVAPPTGRSWLFAPADDRRKLEKVLRSGAAAVIADIEDAVSDERKRPARRAAVAFAQGASTLESTTSACEATASEATASACEAIACEATASACEATATAPDSDASTQPLRVVRINDPRTATGRADLDALRGTAALVMVPKATLASLEIAHAAVAGLVALVETPSGVVELERIAVADGVLAVALGSVDLATELGLRALPGGEELLYVRSRLAIACAAAGVAAIDGVFLDVRDGAGVESEAAHARALGFDGKLCIHPDQVGPIERGFAPSAEEIAQAERVLAAYELARREQRGAALDGTEMVDLATVRRAQRILDAAEASRTSTSPRLS